MKRLYDIVIPMITPLSKKDNIDIQSLERLTEYLIQKEVDCLYPCGTTGEMVYLSNEERKVVVETVVKTTAGRIPVFAQVGGANTRDTIMLAKHAVRSGADGIGVVTPWYFQLSSKAIVDYYCEVSKAVPLDFPIYMYGIPQNAVNDITEEIVREVVCRCRNVIGIKYSAPDLTRIQQFIKIKDGEFDVLVGPDHLYSVVAAAGGVGVVSGNAMIIPKYYNEIKKAIHSQNWELARIEQSKTNVLNEILCKKNNIACYKAILKEVGIISTNKMRKPMESISRAYINQVLKELRDVMSKNAVYE